MREATTRAYQLKSDPSVIVQAVQFDPQKQPWPEYVIPHDPSCKPRDMTWGYIEISSGKYHVAASDYIFTDYFGDKRVIHRKQFEEAYRPVIVMGTPAQVSSFKRFKLVRTTDITGISGIGEIAVGVQWPDQSATLFWLKTETNGYYKSLAQLQQIHCYNDASGQPNARVEWID